MNIQFSYRWLETFFTDPLPTPKLLAEQLELHSFECEGVTEVENDTLLTFDILPNRASDCYSHRGLAREISAVLNLPYQEPATDVKADMTDLIEVHNQVPAQCPLYSLTSFSLATSKPLNSLTTPLTSLGQRLILPVVDLTNFILHEIGTPLHVFDADKVAGDITVRYAKEGEEIVVLGGETHCLKEWMIVIADDIKPLAIAGVKGGEAAAVTEHTEHVLLEAAYFDPALIRRTTNRLGLTSDAAKHYAAGFSINEVWRGESRFLCLAEQSGLLHEVSVGHSKNETMATKQRTVSLSLSAVKELGGIVLSTEEIVSLLERAHIKVTKQAESLLCHIPPERVDVTTQEEVVEEVCRLYGYENIAPISIAATDDNGVVLDSYLATEWQVRHNLTQVGFTEVITSTFNIKGARKVLNPHSAEKSHLRNSLESGIYEVWNKNQPISTIIASTPLSLFEIGHTFEQNQEYVSIALLSKNMDVREVYQDTVLPILEKIDLDVEVVKKEKDYVEVRMKFVTTSNQQTALMADMSEPAYKDYGSYYQSFATTPYIMRDISVWCDNELARKDLEVLVESFISPYLVGRPRLLDTFSKDGRTSLTYRLVFQAPDQTLTDDQVNQIVKSLYDDIARNSGLEVR